MASWYNAPMAKNNIQEQIQDRIESFVGELTGLVRQAGLEAVQEALGAGTPPKRRGRRKKTRKAPARRKVVKRKATKATKAGKRAKRSTTQVDEVSARILSHVKAHQGTGVTEMGLALHMTPKDMRLPILRLLETKKLKTTGQRRGTKYHAGGRSTGVKKKRASKQRSTKKRSAKKTGRRKTKRTGKTASKKK